jgi:hypothetical protein
MSAGTSRAMETDLDPQHTHIEDEHGKCLAVIGEDPAKSPQLSHMWMMSSRGGHQCEELFHRVLVIYVSTTIALILEALVRTREIRLATAIVAFESC